MKNITNTILVIDDDPASIILMKSALHNQYSINGASNSVIGLASLNTRLPDLILLDISSPNMSAYETCKTIKEKPHTKDIPVIFLSGKNSLSDRLKGYTAGADDYITKPFEIEEVRAKIHSLLKNQQSHNHTKNIARLAMSNASEIGLINQFYQNSFTCTSGETLANQIIRTCQLFNLECSLQMRLTASILNVSSTREQCTPLELDLFRKVKNERKIFHFGSRAVFNFPKTTLVIKNMPRHDENQCGRLCDHLASLLSGVEARISAIEMETQQRNKVLHDLQLTLDNVHSAINNVDQGISSRSNFTANTISSLLDEMHYGFSSLSLSETQEEFFVTLVNDHLEKIVSIYTSNTEAERHFRSIANDISDLLVPLPDMA